MCRARERCRRLASQLLPRPCPVSAAGEEAAAADEEAAFQEYCAGGHARAVALGNRGPIRFDANGRLASDILEAYERHGFYVFEGVVAAPELQELRGEFEELLANAPAAPGSREDRRGMPVKHPWAYDWVKPLSDPLGGTDFGIHNFRGGETRGRHHIRMREPAPRPGTPELEVQRVSLPAVLMDSALRVSVHPDLLRVADAINGPDFVPHFIETLFYKPAFTGTSTAWHQDPSSAWDEEWRQPGFDAGTMGFNMHVSLYACTPGNALWVLPGSHLGGRTDIGALAASGDGSDRLPGAVPVVCQPGDVYIHSRAVLHGAFANTSPDTRCTLQFGFHRRGAVLGVSTKGYVAGGGGGGREVTYDDEYVRERCKMYMWAIDARRQKYPHEAQYTYLPFQGEEDKFRWHPGLKESSYNKYHKRSLII